MPRLRRLVTRLPLLLVTIATGCDSSDPTAERPPLPSTSKSPPIGDAVTTRTVDGCVTKLPIPVGLTHLGAPVRVPTDTSTVQLTWIPTINDRTCQQQHTSGNQAQARALAAAINSAPLAQDGTYNCPTGAGLAVVTTFEGSPPVVVSLDGCPFIQQYFSSARYKTNLTTDALLPLSPPTGAWRSALTRSR